MKVYIPSDEFCLILSKKKTLLGEASTDLS